MVKLRTHYYGPLSFFYYSTLDNGKLQIQNEEMSMNTWNIFWFFGNINRTIEIWTCKIFYARILVVIFVGKRDNLTWVLGRTLAITSHNCITSVKVWPLSELTIGRLANHLLEAAVRAQTQQEVRTWTAIHCTTDDFYAKLSW